MPVTGTGPPRRRGRPVPSFPIPALAIPARLKVGHRQAFASRARGTPAYRPGAPTPTPLRTCGPGKPFLGQPKGLPSMSRRVYSCSMPNQGTVSFAASMAAAHAARLLVSAKNGGGQQLRVSAGTRSSQAQRTYRWASCCTCRCRRAPACCRRRGRGRGTWPRGAGTCQSCCPRTGTWSCHRSSTRANL